MFAMSIAQIARVVGGTVHDIDPVAAEQIRITGSVEFDSRKVGSGSLFLALPGARVDGHDHAHAAVKAGAVAVLAARPVGVPAIVVKPRGASKTRAMALEADIDGSGAAVLAALAALAKASVSQLSLQDLVVIGVTGSSGKTSTKDLIAAVLSPLGSVVAPPGSFNNELGHPWTALRANDSTKFLVLELSARAVGDIAKLASTAPPRIGVVLNVGSAHLGEFGSKEAISQAKGELAESISSDGVVILNADDPLVLAMRERTEARVVLVGCSDIADIRACDVQLDENACAKFTLVCTAGEIEIKLAVHGEHQVGNALAAAAVALEAGASLSQIAASLGLARATSVRRMDVQTRADGVTVINDSYNANPDSVRAALKALVSMARVPLARADQHASQVHPVKRRTWAVLGEMAELGDASVIEHDGIGRLAVRLDVSRLIVVGTQRPLHGLHQGAVMEGSWGSEAVLVPDMESAIEILRRELEPNDIVLVKASQSVGLWHVAETILSDVVTDTNRTEEELT
ncbi:MAG: UDP-N-acetylmuramoyl-tripeptide--D-alanyl-D-alanine ligase [Mycobacteriaceae bacterium]